MGGVLVHSMSAYQSLEEAARPTLLKALDALYLLWQRQKTGEPVREIELVGNQHAVVSGLDSETWSELRDTFIEHKLISQNERGHYLLSRDLHTVTFWQLKEWINQELPLEKEDISAHMSWQEDAYKLLRDQRTAQRNQLDINLADLFSR
jgi:membrane protein